MRGSGNHDLAAAFCSARALFCRDGQHQNNKWKAMEDARIQQERIGRCDGTRDSFNFGILIVISTFKTLL